MNEREAKLKALENVIVDMAWELTVFKGQKHDSSYWAERMLGAVEQVEVEREYAY